jgi:hypothetical protein
MCVAASLRVRWMVETQKSRTKINSFSALNPAFPSLLLRVCVAITVSFLAIKGVTNERRCIAVHPQVIVEIFLENLQFCN